MQQMASLLLILIAISAISPSLQTTTCSGTKKTECFHGEEIDKYCVCDEGWTGPECQHCQGRFLLDTKKGCVSDGDFVFVRFVNCLWLIKLDPMLMEPNQTLYLTFADVAVSCYGLSMEIYDGDSLASPLLAAYKGTVSPSKTVFSPNLIASSGMALIKFDSPQVMSNKGYVITYEYADYDDDYELIGEKSPNLNTHIGDWRSYEWTALTSQGRGSMSFALNDRYIYIYGGFMFGGEKLQDQMLRFDQIKYSVSAIRPSFVPAARFGHTMISWKDSLIVYGGIIRESYSITNQVWSFNITTPTWVQIHPCLENCTRESDPPTLVGHTAHMVELKDMRNVMLVIFGYHPTWEFSNFVFEYDIVNNAWTKLKTSGAIPHGSYGHASVLDETDNLIYVHGGINAAEKGSMLVYDAENEHWSSLKSTTPQRFLHSIVLINGTLFVYGGRAVYLLQYCEDVPFEAYDLATDNWKGIPTQLSATGNRFGHLGVKLDKTMFVFGGNSGRMFSDVLTYSASSIPSRGTCDITTLQSDCDDSPYCVWKNGTCEEFSCGISESECESICSSKDTCMDCLSTAFQCCKCIYCHQNCPKKCSSTFESRDSRIQSYDLISDVTSCHEEETQDKYCDSFTTCNQCNEADGCGWNGFNCKAGNTTFECPATCPDSLSCSNCTSYSGCVWCETTDTCLSTDVVDVYYSYSSCTDYRNKKEQCTDPCSAFNNCDDCHENKACGWCATDKDTGVGTCMSGSLYAPLNNVTCNGNWFYLDCPDCQCNGHSTCENETVCANCTDNTDGETCEDCDALFYGNPTNGKNCTACECNGHADDCDKNDGTCFCRTYGITGDQCQRCRYVDHVTGDPFNGTCYYSIEPQYKYQFKFESTYWTQMNFDTCPRTRSDLLMSVVSEYIGNTDEKRRFNMVVTYNYSTSQDGNDTEVFLAEYTNRTTVQIFFSQSQFAFGKNPLKCIRVYLEFTTPFHFYISLVQTYTNIGLLLAVFFTCFIILLVLAIVVWKVNSIWLRCQMRRIREVELREMAARPFACIDFEYQHTASKEIQAFSEEIGEDERCAVGTTLLSMPFGFSSECVQPYIAFGSALFRSKSSGKSKSMRRRSARHRRRSSANSNSTVGIDNPVLDLHTDIEQTTMNA
ncbi:attractin-like protein 1 [Styela clava]